MCLPLANLDTSLLQEVPKYAETFMLGRVNCNAFRVHLKASGLPNSEPDRYAPKFGDEDFVVTFVQNVNDIIGT